MQWALRASGPWTPLRRNVHEPDCLPQPCPLPSADDEVLRHREGLCMLIPIACAYLVGGQWPLRCLRIFVGLRTPFCTVPCAPATVTSGSSCLGGRNIGVLDRPPTSVRTTLAARVPRGPAWPGPRTGTGRSRRKSAGDSSGFASPVRRGPANRFPKSDAMLVESAPHTSAAWTARSSA